MIAVLEIEIGIEIGFGLEHAMVVEAIPDDPDIDSDTDFDALVGLRRRLAE
jgi:hypothetical protein